MVNIIEEAGFETDPATETSFGIGTWPSHLTNVQPVKESSGAGVA